MRYSVHSATPFEVTYKVIKDNQDIGQLTMDNKKHSFKASEGFIPDEAVIQENKEFHVLYVEAARSIS